MNCYYHPEQPAVSQCGICGKGMCKECVDAAFSLDGRIMCDSCAFEMAQKYSKEKKKLIIKYSVLIVLSSALLLLGLLIWFSKDSSAVHFSAWLAVGILALPLTIYNRIKNGNTGRPSNSNNGLLMTPEVFLVAKGVGFLASCAMTVLIGPIAVIIALIKSIKALMTANKLGKDSEMILSRLEQT